MKLRWIIVLLACLFVTPASAKKYGHQVRFAGIHPVPKSEGGGICHIEFPHVHIYAANKLEYRTVADNNVFVGDPVAYGWDGPKYAYKGAHPVQVNVIAGTPEPMVQYCYINGPHYHYFEPPDGPDFQVVGGAYFYVGDPPQAMIDMRPQYVGINAVYEPMVYTRPVVEVEAPTTWVMMRPAFMVTAPSAAVVVDPGPPGHAYGRRGRGDVEVVGGVGVSAGVQVSVPVPTIGIGVHVGGPAVIVAPGGPPPHGKFKHGKFKHH